MFYRGIKPRGEAEWLYNPIKHAREFIERLQKHSTKSLSGIPNKGSNCEGKILAYKKTSYALSVFFI